MKVDEVERLFWANENVDPEVCGLITLGIFAGMRTSAVARVEYNLLVFRKNKSQFDSKVVAMEYTRKSYLLFFYKEFLVFLSFANLFVKFPKIPYLILHAILL